MHALVNGSVVACILVLLAGNARPQAAKVTMDDLLGDWLFKGYVGTLKKTKSPWEAIKPILQNQSRYTALRFTKESGGYEWLVIINFHEGLTYNIDGIRPTGTNTYALVYDKEQDSGRETENDRIVYPDGSSDALSWVFTLEGKEQRIQFIRVKPSMEAYVNRVVLVGNYTDISGRSFVFTDACEAKWPGKTFTYEIGLDHIFPECDYIYVPAERDGTKLRAYAFEWKNGKLLVYNVRYSNDADVMHPSGDPLYVLTPKRK
jgi:hypothetical protein